MSQHEIRYITDHAAGNLLDEIVAHDAYVHFEVMDTKANGDTVWWCGITMPDGTAIHLDFTAKKIAKHPEASGLLIRQERP